MYSDAPWSNCLSYYPLATGGKEAAIFISLRYISHYYSLSTVDILCRFAWLFGDILLSFENSLNMWGLLSWYFLTVFESHLVNMCIVSHTLIFLISRRACVFVSFCRLILNKFIYVPRTTSSSRYRMVGTKINFGCVSASLLSVGSFTRLFSSIFLGLLVPVLCFIKNIWQGSWCCLSESQVLERINSHV